MVFFLGFLGFLGFGFFSQSWCLLPRRRRTDGPRWFFLSFTWRRGAQEAGLSISGAVQTIQSACLQDTSYFSSLNYILMQLTSRQQAIPGIKIRSIDVPPKRSQSHCFASNNPPGQHDALSGDASYLRRSYARRGTLSPRVHNWATAS